MLKILSAPEFTHAVTVMVPVDDGHEEQTFKVRFRLLSGEGSDPLAARNSDEVVAFLKRAIVSFEDVLDAKDAPMAYSEALRDQLIAVPCVLVALSRAYIAAVTKAKSGN